jgi:hypothetical protein
MLWAARVLARAFGMAGELLSRLRRRPAASDPAEELRSRLAEARARDEEEAAPAADEPAPDVADEPAPDVADEPSPGPDHQPGEPASADLEDLRRDVHARARALSEEMRGAGDQD